MCSKLMETSFSILKVRITSMIRLKFVVKSDADLSYHCMYPQETVPKTYYRRIWTSQLFLKWNLTVDFSKIYFSETVHGTHEQTTELDS